MIRKVSLVIIVVFLAAACATSGHRTVKIRAPEFGAQFVPAQLNSLLNENGFRRIKFQTRVRDLNAGASDDLNMKSGEVIMSSDKLLMRYQHQTYPALQVDVSIVRDSGKVRMEFHETDRKALSAEGLKIYQHFVNHLKSSIYDEEDVSAN